MRATFFTALLAILIPGVTSAQLSYLGPDKLLKGSDPYQTLQLAGGMVTLGNDVYFTTPSGKLYRTDGTEEGTKAVYTAKGQSMPILAATSRFLYIGVQDPGYASFMHRYTPGTNKLQAMNLEEPVRNFRFNNNRMPGYNLMADYLKVSPDRKYIAFRIFMNDAISLNIVSDDAPEHVKTVKYCSPSEISSLDLSIYPSSEIAFVRDEVFVNGNERDLLTTKMGTDGKGNVAALRTGNRAFTASSLRKSPKDATTWYLGSYYFLDTKGYTLYKGLMECGGQLYSLVSKKGTKTVGEFKIVHYDSTQLLLSKEALPGDNYYTAEVHGNSIYVLTTGKIYRYDPSGDRFVKIFEDAGSGWNQVFDTELALKSGRYLLTRSRNRLMLIDELNGTATDLNIGEPGGEPNRFSFGDRYAWATKRAFYAIDKSSGTAVFTRFSPDSRKLKAIPMPEIDRATFTQFRAVFQLGDRFLLLTEYRNRRGDPVYNMFMYRDEAA